MNGLMNQRALEQIKLLTSDRQKEICSVLERNNFFENSFRQILLTCPLIRWALEFDYKYNFRCNCSITATLKSVIFVRHLQVAKWLKAVKLYREIADFLVF